MRWNCAAQTLPATDLRRGLTKVYRSGEVEVRALAGVDLELFPDEFVVLLGRSGSGKSTLLDILGGLDRASSGTVTFKGLELTALDDQGLTLHRRAHVGFVFQFHNLIPSLTARPPRGGCCVRPSRPDMRCVRDGSFL